MSASAKIDNKIDVEVLTKSTKSWDGINLPSYLNEQSEISILKIVIPPGAELPLHKHPVRESRGQPA